MAKERSYSEEGEWIYCKNSIGLESAGNQKERKIAANLEKDSFGGSSTMWFISEVLHTVCFIFKNEFILQNTFTGLQCNLHCALSQRSNLWASLVFLSGRLRFWRVWLLRSPRLTPPQCFWSVSLGVVSSELVQFWRVEPIRLWLVPKIEETTPCETLQKHWGGV
jgi:hypothetical protein